MGRAVASTPAGSGTTSGGGTGLGDAVKPLTPWSFRTYLRTAQPMSTDHAT
jgi:hypothetical protein